MFEEPLLQERSYNIVLETMSLVINHVNGLLICHSKNTSLKVKVLDDIHIIYHNCIIAERCGFHCDNMYRQTYQIVTNLFPIAVVIKTIASSYVFTHRV